MKLFILAAAVLLDIVYKIKKPKNSEPVRLTPSVDFEMDMGKIHTFQRLAYKKAA